MNNKFLNLLEKLDLLDKKDVLNGEIKEVSVNDADKCWFFDIEFSYPLGIDDFDLFTRRLELLPTKIASIEKTQYKISYTRCDYEKLEEYYDFVLKKLSKKKPRFTSILDFEIDILRNKIEVICPNDATFVSELLFELKDELALLGFDCVLATKMCQKTPLIKEKIVKDRKSVV